MNTYTESIDFVTVIFKRLDYAKIIHESIKKYVDYPYKYYIVNNGDNSESSVELKQLKEMFDGEENVVIVEGIHQINQDDGGCVPANHNQKYSQQYFIDNYGWDGYTKYDKRALGFGSWLQAEGMTIGTKMGNGKYICQVEHDVVFLNKWVDDILPLADKYFYISNSWQPGTLFREANLSFEEGRGVAVFMFIKRENFEKNNLYPNIDYRSTAGNITYFAQKNSLDFLILKNNFWSKKHCNRWRIPYEKMDIYRYDKEYLKFEDFGDGYEEAWINNKCIIVHMLSHGRFGKKANNTWTDKMEDYINNN